MLLESPLDCKEVKPVHPKGNQPWIFIGRAEAEAPIFWPFDVKGQLTGKDTDAGKDWREKDKDEIVRITDLMDTNLCKLREIVEDTGA